jgi:hypothetical protein
MKKMTLFFLLSELPALVVAGIFIGRYMDQQGWTGGAGSALCIAVAFFVWIGHLVVASRKKNDDSNS